MPIYVILLILPAARLPQAPAEPSDISCEAYNTLATGIERGWALTISGPKEKQWEVRFESMIERERRKVAAGTYELLDGLAVFTGRSDKGEETRFGLNYGFPGGKVQFNAFFPAGDEELRYRRRWFQKVDGAWQLSEELLLTVPRAAPNQDVNRWQVRLTGERRRWDKAGKVTTVTIDKTLTYAKDGGTPGFFNLEGARPAQDPVPVPSRLRVVGKSVEEDVSSRDAYTRPELRGFGAGLPEEFKRR
jgi:hypothetical protein